MIHNTNVTVTLTSCGRLDLLKRTLDSFFEFNTYPIKEMIIRDDSGKPEVMEQLIELRNTYPDREIRLLENSKIGQIRSVDSMMAHVTTPYVFHIEDDWEFYKSGFIEKSLKILEHDAHILAVWIRGKDDGIAHDPEELMRAVDGVAYAIVGTSDWLNCYSYNPHLKRMIDYIKPYEVIGVENDIGLFYKTLGFKTAWLIDGYVKHIGGGRSTFLMEGSIRG